MSTKIFANKRDFAVSVFTAGYQQCECCGQSPGDRRLVCFALREGGVLKLCKPCLALLANAAIAEKTIEGIR